MKHININKIYYRLRHQYITTNNLVIAVALFIAVSWAWGSIGVLQRNYALQKEIDGKQKQLQLVELETDTLRYQQKYYQSDEYKELAVRQRLGLVFPGEKVLILPPNSPDAAKFDSYDKPSHIIASQPTNMEQWMNFLFGASKR